MNKVEIPEKWSVKCLGDAIISLPKSGHPASKANEKGYFNFYVCSEKIEKSFICDMSMPAVLLSTGGEASVHYATGKYSYSTDVWAMKFNGDILCEFAYRLLENSIDEINYSGFQGSGIKHLDKNYIETLEFCIPPLSEQKEIVTILAVIDVVIRNYQRYVDKLLNLRIGTMSDLMKKGILHQRFKDSPIGEIPENWSFNDLDEIAEIKRGASPRPIRDSKWWGGNVGWTRISDVTISSKYLKKTQDYLSDDGVKKSVRIPIGDVILSICATIGRPIIVDTDVCIHDGFVWFKDLSKRIDRDFFYYFLCSIEETLSSNRQVGTQGNLNTDIISKIILPIPSLAEQKKISTILSSIDDMITTSRYRLWKTKILKKSVMHDLLSGKVRVLNN